MLSLENNNQKKRIKKLKDSWKNIKDCMMKRKQRERRNRILLPRKKS